MKTSTLNAIATIINNKRNFYANEYNINGGIISCLAHDGLIEKTGNSKYETIELYNGDYKTIKVYEWRISYDTMRRLIVFAEAVREQATEMLAFVEAVESLC